MYKILITDGSNICHRSYHQSANWIKQEDFDTLDEWVDVMTQASLTTTIQSIAKFIGESQAIAVFVPLDTEGDIINRVAAAGQYKERSDDPKYIVVNRVRHHLLTHLPKLGIHTHCKTGYEADDFGYVLSTLPVEELLELCGIDWQKLEGEEVHTDMLTRDQDWLQSVHEDCTWVAADTMERTSHADMVAQYGPEYRVAFLIKKCLLGDASDGIDGIKGIGPAKVELATRCIHDKVGGTYFSKDKVEELLVSEGLRGYKWTDKLLEQWEKFELNWKLMDLNWCVTDPNGAYEDMVRTISAFSIMMENPAAPFDQVEWSRIVHATQSTKLGTAQSRLSEFQGRRQKYMLGTA